MKRKLIEKSVKIGKGVKIEDDVQLLGATVLCDGVVVRSGSRISDSFIGQGTSVDHSIITSSTIGQNCVIGPFSYIRPNVVLHDNVKVGAFVEVKNAEVGQGSKLPHLSYIGDADIGKNCNIGCGVIFANYNGKIKRHSSVGDNVFVGSNVNIVAPIKIADDSYICAGMTITKDTQKADFVIARPKEMRATRRSFQDGECEKKDKMKKSKKKEGGKGEGK